jgi:hypothetical protein
LISIIVFITNYLLIEIKFKKNYEIYFEVGLNNSDNLLHSGYIQNLQNEIIEYKLKQIETEFKKKPDLDYEKIQEIEIKIIKNEWKDITNKINKNIKDTLYLIFNDNLTFASKVNETNIPESSKKKILGVFINNNAFVNLGYLQTVGEKYIINYIIEAEDLEMNKQFYYELNKKINKTLLDQTLFYIDYEINLLNLSRDTKIKKNSLERENFIKNFKMVNFFKKKETDRRINNKIHLMLTILLTAFVMLLIYNFKILFRRLGKYNSSINI